MNNDIRYALEYHEATKHSEISIQTSGHYLDWDNKPRPFKIYTKLPSIPLPQDFCKPSLDAITSISKIKSIAESTATTTTSAVDIKKLAEILFFSAGITREMDYPYGTYYMRAASATGALYPIELYVVCQDIPGLRAGVYHFCPGDFTLTELRNGDYRGKLSAAAGESKNIMASPIIIIFSSIAWRNAWKYQARSYRHWFWDSGVIAANLLGTTVSNNIRSFLIMGFVDDIVNRILLLDDKREAAIAMAAIGIGLGLSKNQVGSNSKEIISSSSLPSPEVLPLSKKAEVEYPEIWRVHQASTLSNTEEVKQWSNSASSFKKQDRTSRIEILNSQPLQYEEPSSSFQPGLGDVILLRGSSRRFARKPISFMQLSTILHASTRGIPLDFLGQDGDRTAIDVYMIVNDVEGLERGSYFFNRSAGSLEQLKRNVPRNMSGYLCLGQNLFSDASIVFFLMTDLLEVLSAYGNRGYRSAQFEAGIVAGKIYLSSYAQQLGASGSTFFDDAVSEFFSPHAKDKSTMIAVGVGIPGYKARPGKILAGALSKSQIIKEAF
ncbi:MAG TPA: SagB/ThcOx family dehydrogenase [Nitrososphaeraceae archaeon]|nr:SagB/ThcOx family dehydrogenase [Nitrososphaeraceae archaeon]